MEDGKVTFNHEIKAPSLSKEQLYKQMLDWANNRFKSDGKLQSRVVYTNEKEGDIAASAEEYIVFSSSAPVTGSHPYLLPVSYQCGRWGMPHDHDPHPLLV